MKTLKFYLLQNNILGTCAHVINIVALENLYKSPTNDKSDPLNKVIKKFTDEKRFQHWSKVFIHDFYYAFCFICSLKFYNILVYKR